MFSAAVEPKEMPALPAILLNPFRLAGSHILEIALAPTTPLTLETEKLSRPSGRRAVNVLRIA
jgi:hypothetical protein